MYGKIKRCDAKTTCRINDNNKIAMHYMNNYKACKLNSTTEIL